MPVYAYHYADYERVSNAAGMNTAAYHLSVCARRHRRIEVPDYDSTIRAIQSEDMMDSSWIQNVSQWGWAPANSFRSSHLCAQTHHALY